jgi:hypothetical protein
MATRISRDPIYRRRRFSAETIELCVRWYITYRLSYRDLVAMIEEPLVPQKLCGDNTGIITITEVTSDNQASRYS